MEENTITPVVEDDFQGDGQTTETIIQENNEEVTGQEKEENKVPRNVPYSAITKKSAVIRDLRAKVASLESELADLRNTKQTVDEYLHLLEANPNYAQDIQKVYKKHFPSGNQLNEYDEDNYEDNYEDNGKNEIDKLFQRIAKVEELQLRQQIEQQMDKEMDTVMREMASQGHSFTQNDIYNVMLKNDVSSPMIAYKILVGDNLSKIKQQWENSYNQKIKNIPPGTVSVGGLKGKLQMRIPQNFDEAYMMAMKSDRQIVK